MSYLRPTHCPECEKIFEASSDIRAKAIHIALSEGSDAAASYLDDVLEEEHVSHSEALS